ncbi:MAG: hypothetical protein AAGA56_28655 [Myxococcota bacterium]
MKQAVLLLTSLALAACTKTPPANSARISAGGSSITDPDDNTAPQQLEPMTIVGYTTDELLARFGRARNRMLAGEHLGAASEFDDVSRLASDPELVATSLYNAGLGYAKAKQPELALRRYQDLDRRFGEQSMAGEARLRAMRILSYLERWPELAGAAKRVLNRPDLNRLERIEAYGHRALAEVSTGDLAGARVSITKAQTAIEKAGLGRSGPPPVELATVSFAEGELRRIESEQIRLFPVPANFGEALEQRCQGLLDAQSSYTEAMRSNDPHWAAKSGFRVGQLYQRLHEEAMKIPPPATADDRQRALFTSAMRLRYRILLKKGLRMMEGTVRLSARTGEDSVWIDRAKQAKAELERSLAEEKAVLARSPYTEEEIQAALDKLRGDG